MPNPAERTKIPKKSQTPPPLVGLETDEVTTASVLSKNLSQHEPSSTSIVSHSLILAGITESGRSIIVAQTYSVM